MEITKKEEFECLFQEALKNVQVTAKPYPLREQKLIARGEDVAYLREAILERLRLSDYEYDIKAQDLKSTRILKTVADYRNEYYYIRGLFISHAWMNEDNLLEIKDVGPFEKDAIGEKIAARNKEFGECRETKLISQKWFDRVANFEMSSTFINRLFADVERMSVLDKSPFYLYQEAYTFRVPGDHIDNTRYEDRVRIDGFENGYLYWSLYDGVINEARKFYFIYGDKFEADRIEMITADVLIEKADYPDNEPSKDEYRIVKLKFLPEKTPHEDWVKELDDLEESYNKNLSALIDDRKGKEAEAKDQLEKAEADATEVLNKAFKEAENKEQETKKNAHLKFIEEMRAINSYINAKIVKQQETNPDDNNIMDDAFQMWLEMEGDAYEIELNAVTQAEENRITAEKEAVAAYENSLVEPNERYSFALNEIEDNFNSQKNLLDQQLSAAQDEVLNRRGELLKAINAEYDNSVQAASDERDAAEDKARDAAEEELNKYFSFPDEYVWTTEDGKIVPVFAEDYEPSEEEVERMDEIRQTLFSAYREINNNYLTAKTSAEKTRWQKRKDLLPFDKNNRVMFSCEVPCYGEPSGRYSYLWVDGIYNIAIHFKPKTNLGMDLSHYQEELEKEKNTSS